MPSIIENLVIEHRVFAQVFDHIEAALPDLTTLAEVRLLVSLVERLLRGHATAETDLAYAALDQVLNERGRLDVLHQDHREIDDSLRSAGTATNLEEARRLLKSALAASRDHFRREERSVFPLIESVLQPGSLAALSVACSTLRGDPTP
jgi:hemerythrin-like domain-containing protein